MVADQVPDEAVTVVEKNVIKTITEKLDDLVEKELEKVK
jgi:hypothetical protein